MDNYEHTLDSIYYTTTRIAGPGAPLELDQEYSFGCDCSDGCQNTFSCTCQLQHKHFSDDRGKRFLCDIQGLGPVNECHDGCNCSHTVKSIGCEARTLLLAACSNRLVQFGPRDSLTIFPTSNRGFGLSTSNKILSGEFICEYAGEVIGIEESKKRIRLNKSLGNMNYVFILNEFVQTKKIVTCVDPSLFGNIGRYINHSCLPNAVVIPVRTGSPVPRICIFASKDIFPREEITFDYGNSEYSSLSETACKCGTEFCRKWLPGSIET